MSTSAAEIVLLGLLALAAAGCKFEIPRDDSDAPTPGPRSGMYVLHDELTGCEYLARGDGLTPRLDPYGRQVCRKRGEPIAIPTPCPCASEATR